MIRGFPLKCRCQVEDAKTAEKREEIADASPKAFGRRVQKEVFYECNASKCGKERRGEDISIASGEFFSGKMCRMRGFPE